MPGPVPSNVCPEPTRAVALHLRNAVERFEGSVETLIDVLRAVGVDELSAAEAAEVRGRLDLTAGQLEQVVTVLGERAAGSG